MLGELQMSGTFDNASFIDFLEGKFSIKKGKLANLSSLLKFPVILQGFSK